MNNKLGAKQKVCHLPRRGGGLDKKVTKCDNGGSQGSQKSDVTHPKNFTCSFSSFFFSNVFHKHVFMKFLFYSTCLWWKWSKILDKIIARERLFFIDFLDKVWQGGRKIAILGVTYFLHGPKNRKNGTIWTIYRRQ